MDAEVKGSTKHGGTKEVCSLVIRGHSVQEKTPLLKGQKQEMRYKVIEYSEMKLFLLTSKINRV